MNLPNHRFSVEFLANLASKLTFTQRQLLDEVWNFHVKFGNPFPLRSIPHIVGKQSTQEAFNGLNGSLVYETSEQGGRSFKLTVYGALLTGHGHVLSTLLIRLLELVNILYESDSYINEISRAQVIEKMKITEVDANLLFRLLSLNLPPDMPIYLSSSMQDGSEWKITITDEVTSLFRADSAEAYLDDRLSAGYDPEVPWSYMERMTRVLPSKPFMTPNDFNHTLQPTLATYINPSRLAELKSINNSSFDCTRLICMCEELNECASRKNAHAVILLTRAILDHVPPAFGYKSFAEVSSNYADGGSSFRQSIEHLERQARKVADRLLHMPIRNKEVAPNMNEVSFISELETLLAEIFRRLK